MYLILKDNKKLEIKEYKNFIKKLQGLMFKKEKINYIVRLNNCNSIHTFFMKENIDVIGFDNHGIIIFKAVNVEKNKVIVIKEQLKNTNILEMPAFKSKKLKMYDKLTFIRK